MFDFFGATQICLLHLSCSDAFSIRSIPSCPCGHRLGDLWSLRSGVLGEKSWFGASLEK